MVQHRRSDTGRRAFVRLLLSSTPLIHLLGISGTTHPVPRATSSSATSRGSSIILAQSLTFRCFPRSTSRTPTPGHGFVEARQHEVHWTEAHRNGCFHLPADPHTP